MAINKKCPKCGRKTIIILLLIAICSLAFTGCFPTTTTTTTQTVKRNNMTTPSVTEGEGVLENVVNVGDTITGKDWEITIEHIEFSQRVDSPKKEGLFSFGTSYYQVDDSDKTYLYCILNCKNISTISLSPDEAAMVKAIYDDKYKYGSFSRILDDGFESLAWKSIDPLTNEKIYYFAEMPKFIADETDTPVEVQIRIENQTYHCIVREAAVVDEVDESAEPAETESAGEN